MSKTRLIPQIGSQGAAEVAAALLDDTWACWYAQTEVRCWLSTTGDTGWWPGPAFSQGEGDLGQRIEHTLAELWVRGARQVAVVGADGPGLPDEVLEALRGVRGREAVLTPARDGGFVAMALGARLPPGALDGLPWSVGTTRVSVQQRLEALGFVVRLTTSWVDIDTWEDARAWLALPGVADRAPSTHRVLTRY